MLGKVIKWQVLGLFGFLFCISFVNATILPDIFSLSKISNKKELVFRLFSTSISFSGVLLAIIVVLYNSFIRTTRRNTISFIFDNYYLQLIFSIFLGLLFFLGLSFFFVEADFEVNEITLIYFDFYIVFIFILSVFPLTILALQNSSSISKVYKKIDLIDEISIREIFYSTKTDSNTYLSEIEQNPLIFVKDMCINSVIDKDWRLPQEVLTRLYKKTILSISNKDESTKVEYSLLTWYYLCNHLKGEVIKNDDNLTGKTILNLSLDAHKHLAEKQILTLRDNPIDDFLIEYLRLVVEKNVLFEIHSRLGLLCSQVLLHHYRNIKYSDIELPTTEYNLSLPLDAPRDYRDTIEKEYWFYITRFLPDIFFKTIEAAIFFNRKDVYDSFSLHLYNIFSAIYSFDNLTVFQKREVICEIIRKADILSECAINHKIYNQVDVVSNILIEKWLIEDKKLGYRSFFTFVRMLKRLDKSNALSEYYIDSFFMIGRSLALQNAPTEILADIVDKIVGTSLEILKQKDSSSEFHNIFMYQLQWLKTDYLDKKIALRVIKEKYKDTFEQIGKS